MGYLTFSPFLGPNQFNITKVKEITRILSSNSNPKLSKNEMNNKKLTALCPTDGQSTWKIANDYFLLFIFVTQTVEGCNILQIENFAILTPNKYLIKGHVLVSKVSDVTTQVPRHLLPLIGFKIFAPLKNAFQPQIKNTKKQ